MFPPLELPRTIQQSHPRSPRRLPGGSARPRLAHLLDVFRTAPAARAVVSYKSETGGVRLLQATRNPQSVAAGKGALLGLGEKNRGVICEHPRAAPPAKARCLSACILTRRRLGVVRV